MNVELRLPPDSRPAKDLFTFEDFSKQPEYIGVNRLLIRRLLSYFPPRFHHVDIATGTGLIPQLITEEAEQANREGEIIGIDPNTTSLNIARANTYGTGNILVKFIEGKGQDLKILLYGKIPEEGVDSVSIHDAIHEIEGEEVKRDIIKEMKKLLKNGGLFSYNSAFTTAGMEGAVMEWGKWKLAAFNLLNAKRDKEVKPMEIHKPEEYREMIESAGLVVIHEEKKVVNLSKTALETISRYPKFVEGVFADMKDTLSVSLEQKSQALIGALGQLRITTLPRTWHEIIAQKPSPRTTSLA